MAVLEARSSATHAGTTGAFDVHDTVVIADHSATAHAKAGFQPRIPPYIGDAAPLLAPHEAYVVGGSVYYIDGFGTVWSMDTDGKQLTVARFPIGVTQQEVSFAVSPDGCQLAAAVLTIPPKGPPPSGAQLPTLSGTWKLETMESAAGGGATVMHTWTGTTYPGSQGGFDNLTLVGWDASGPIVVVGAPLGTQSATFIDNPDFFGGTVAHLDAQGVPTAPIATSGCTPVQVSGLADITCAAPSSDGQSVSISVLSSNGAVMVAPLSVAGVPDVAVGPNGMIAVTGQWRNGTSTGTLPANFQPEGWIDSATLFGRIVDASHVSGDAAFAHLGGGHATIEDLRFVGDYVGVLA